MLSIMRTILFLSFFGFMFYISGCGKNFDEYATELGLAFDSPDVANRPIPSFKTDISPILTNHKTFGQETQVFRLGFPARSYVYFLTKIAKFVKYI